jgi:hypothetical protein
MKLNVHATCEVCGAEGVVHIDGKPHGNHVKSKRHQSALHASEAPRDDGAPRPVIACAASNHGEGHPS